MAFFERNIVIGFEKHLDPYIHDNEVLKVNICSFCRDRKDCWSIAIMIVKNSLIVEHMSPSMSSEIVAVEVTTHRQPIVIAVCYRPQKILKKMKLMSLLNSPFCIRDDFNLVDIDWDWQLRKSYSVIRHLRPVVKYASPVW